MTGLAERPPDPESLPVPESPLPPAGGGAESKAAQPIVG
jgi:hypothetical protein